MVRSRPLEYLNIAGYGRVSGEPEVGEGFHRPTPASGDVNSVCALTPVVVVWSLGRDRVDGGLALVGILEPNRTT